MKKVFICFLFICSLFLFLSCSLFEQSKKNLQSQIEQLENTNDNLLEKLKKVDTDLKENEFEIRNLKQENENLREEINQLIDTQKEYEKIANGMLISDSNTNGHRYIRRVYVDSIQTRNLDHSTISDIYSSYIDGKKIGNFMEGDIITLSELIFIDSKDVWAKIETDSLLGYIFLNPDGYGGFDWYNNNHHTYLKTISTKNEKFIIRNINLDKKLELDKPIQYQDVPGKSGKIIGSFRYVNKFTPTSVKITAYTSDCNWIYVVNDEGSGWVPRYYLMHDKGGSPISPPEYYLTIYLVEQQ